MVDRYRLEVAEARAILDRSGESGDGTELVAIRAGAVGSLYEIRREHTPDLVIKIYPEPVADRMRTEAHVYRLLSNDEAIPVPRVVLADDSRHLLPLPYLLMSRIEGRRLADVRDDLPSDELHGVYRQMAEVLRHIHAHRYAACGPIIAGSLRPVGTNAAFMRTQFADWLRDFESLGGPPALARRLRDHIHRAWSSVESVEGGSLCHNDYLDGNIIIGEYGGRWQVTGVVDVERAIVADPLFDVARITRARSELSDAYATAYGDLDRARLALYELYHVVELWNWFAETEWAEQLPTLEDDISRRIKTRGR